MKMNITPNELRNITNNITSIYIDTIFTKQLKRAAKLGFNSVTLMNLEHIFSIDNGDNGGVIDGRYVIDIPTGFNHHEAKTILEDNGFMVCMNHNQEQIYQVSW